LKEFVRNKKNERDRKQKTGLRLRGEARVSRLGGGLEPRAWRAREREPITGVWEQSPERGPEAEPLVGGQLKTFKFFEAPRSHISGDQNVFLLQFQYKKTFANRRLK